MEQTKKKQVHSGDRHLKDAAPKVLVEQLKTTTSRIQLATSVSDEDLIVCIKKAIENIVAARGFNNFSLGSDDDHLSALLARFLQQKDYHTGFMIWGKSGCGMTTRLKAVNLLMQCLSDLVPESDYSTMYVAAYDLVYPHATVELFEKMNNVDLLILDDLVSEQGRGETSRLAKTLIADLLFKRHNEMRPTIISSMFDIDNLGGIYGQRVAEIIRESYYVVELTTNFRREIINSRQGENPQNYET